MINIYEYPTDPKLLDDYRIAVMQAAREGKKVQYRHYNDSEWWPCSSTPTWDWVHAKYRIDPDSKPKEYVPWDLESAPKDPAVFLRKKSPSDATLRRISSYNRDGLVFSVTIGTLSWGLLYQGYEWSADLGKTWSPCGVLK